MPSEKEHSGSSFQCLQSCLKKCTRFNCTEVCKYFWSKLDMEMMEMSCGNDGEWICGVHFRLAKDKDDIAYLHKGLGLKRKSTETKDRMKVVEKEIQEL